MHKIFTIFIPLLYFSITSHSFRHTVLLIFAFILCAFIGTILSIVNRKGVNYEQQRIRTQRATCTIRKNE